MARSIESQRSLWMNGIWVAAFLLTGPILGWIGTVLGMNECFETIERMKAPTPDDLASGVYTSMFATIIGLVMGVLGALLLGLCLIKLSGLKSAATDSSTDDTPAW